MVGFCLLCNWNNMERFFIRERLICRGEDQNKLAWKNLTLLNQNMILKTTFLYFEEVCWKHFEMKSVWSAGLTLRLTRPSGTRNLHLDEKSFQRLKPRKDLCCSFTVLRQMKVLRFTPAVTWKRRPLMFFTDALGFFFSIQNRFDVHQQVGKPGPAVRAVPRLFDPFDSTDLRLYSHLDGPPINKNEVTSVQICQGGGGRANEQIQRLEGIKELMTNVDEGREVVKNTPKLGDIIQGVCSHWYLP